MSKADRASCCAWCMTVAVKDIYADVISAIQVEPKCSAPFPSLLALAAGRSVALRRRPVMIAAIPAFRDNIPMHNLPDSTSAW